MSTMLPFSVGELRPLTPTPITAAKKNSYDRCSMFPRVEWFPGITLQLWKTTEIGQGNTIIGTRIKLLGVLYAGPQHIASGEIVIPNIPTTSRPIAISRIPNNLRIYYQVLMLAGSLNIYRGAFPALGAKRHIRCENIERLLPSDSQWNVNSPCPGYRWSFSQSLVANGMLKGAVSALRRIRDFTEWLAGLSQRVGRASRAASAAERSGSTSHTGLRPTTQPRTLISDAPSRIHIYRISTHPRKQMKWTRPARQGIYSDSK